MRTEEVATMGVVVAGATLVLALLNWSIGLSRADLVGSLAVLGAGFALVSYSACRHGRVGGEPAGALGVLGGATIGLAGVLGLVVPAEGVAGSIEAAGLVGLGAATAGIGLIIAGQLQARSTGRIIQTLSYGALLGVFGLLVASVLAETFLALVDGLRGELSTISVFAVQQVGAGAGFILTAVAAVALSGRGVAYFDVRRPDRQDVLYAIAGTIGILLLAGVLAVLYWLVNLPGSEHTIQRRSREEGPEFLLLAMALTWIAAVIGEELLFRNVIQKHFTERFSASAAILASSGIFAAVHIPAYSPAAPIGLTAAMLAVFLFSLVLAVAYHRTQNVLVPMVIHGIYNMTVYLSIYVQLLSIG